MVLEAGYEDLDLVADSGVLFQQADVEVQVPGLYDVGLVMNRKIHLNEHLKENVGVLDERCDVTLVLMLGGAQSLKRWRVGVGVEEELNSLHAGVVLATLGVLLWDEEADGGVTDLVVEVEEANGDQQLENECAIQELPPLHELALQRVLQNAADGNFAAVQDEVQVQAVVAVVAEQQMLKPDDEYWGSEMAKSALQLHGVPELLAGLQHQEVLDLAQMKTQFVGACYPLADYNSESFQRAAGFDNK